MITDDVYLAKMKLAGKDNLFIGKKLGMTTAEVEARWASLQNVAEALFANGFVDLHQQAATLSIQYQMLGESLKVLLLALENMVTAEMIRPHIVADGEKTIQNLQRAFIILPPFSLPPPPETPGRN